PLQTLDIAAAKETPFPTSTSKVAVTAQENERLAKLDANTISTTDLTQRNPKELFTDDYMQGLVRLEIPGAGNPELPDIMRQLAAGHEGAARTKLIAKLAGIRKVDPRKLDAEYGRYLVLKKQQEVV